MQILAFLIATAIPLVVLLVIRALDLYQTGSFRTVLFSLAWGAIAFALASVINRYFYFQGLLSVEQIQRYFAPLLEEVLKALVLFVLVRRRNFTYFVDGAIYGFAIGIGFAVVENYQYILATPDAGMGTAISRVLSTNLIHASATALSGVAVGLARFQKGWKRLAITLGGLAAAITLHMVFNNLVTRLSGGMVLILAAVVGFAAVGLIAFIIFRGLAEEREWIKEKLGEADRVTQQEARVVNQLSDLGELLKPLQEKFGAEKAGQVERFLLIQARLGILRKTLDKLNDEKLRASVSRQMDELRAEMDQIRRSVGPYCMAYVRSIYPPETVQVFESLQTRIQEQAAARPASGGANVFASLGQRIPAPTLAAGTSAQPGGETGGSAASQGAAPASVNPASAWGGAWAQKARPADGQQQDPPAGTKSKG